MILVGKDLILSFPKTSRHYDISGEGFDIKLSTIKDANKPHLESVFSDDTMFAEGATSDEITCFIQHDGIYLISMISSEVSSINISFEDSSGTIMLEIDEEDWNGNTVRVDDVVTIYGTVDKSGRVAEIDVTSVEK